MSRSRPATEALEARLAARLVGALSAGQPALPPDAAERLRFARQTALERARAVALRTAEGQRRVPVVALGLMPALGGAHGGRPQGGAEPWWQRAAALLPLVVLIAGLVGIDHWVTQEQISTAADIDTALLADDLPPEAYADPGFVEFLRTEPAEGSRPEPPAVVAEPSA